MRPFAESDLDDLYRLYSDVLTMQSIPPFRPLSMEETARSLEKMMRNFMKSGYGEYAVIERKEKRFIGRCGLQPLENSGFTELDYLFMPDCWGKGYATEASMEVLRSAFNDWGFERIVAVTSETNKASARVLEKIGMQKGGLGRFYGSEMVIFSLEKPKESSDSLFRQSYHQSHRLSLRVV